MLLVHRTGNLRSNRKFIGSGRAGFGVGRRAPQATHPYAVLKDLRQLYQQQDAPVETAQSGRFPVRSDYGALPLCSLRYVVLPAENQRAAEKRIPANALVIRRVPPASQVAENRKNADPMSGLRAGFRSAAIADSPDFRTGYGMRPASPSERYRTSSF